MKEGGAVPRSLDHELTSKIPAINKGLEHLRSYLRTNTLVKEAYIFGSVAEGKETEESDIDLAIISDDCAQLGKDCDWWAKLTLECPCPVDYLFESDVREYGHLANWDKAVKIYER